MMVSPRDIVHTTFGANLQQQGRGYYVALELLAIARGMSDNGSGIVLDPQVSPIRYQRRSHDFARRIATGTHIPEDVRGSAINDDKTLETLQALLSSLIVEIPGRRSVPKWFASHLYPFVGELVHYDAVERRQKPRIERYTYRDAGGLVYKILRSDPDLERRDRVQAGLSSLVSDSHTALGRVAAALHAHDEAAPEEFEDTSEAETVTYEKESPWPEFIRVGLDRILSRSEVVKAKRVENLMHWVPYCVARHQLALAKYRLGDVAEVIPVDATKEAGPLRTRSHVTLERLRWDIVSALQKVGSETLTEAERVGMALPSSIRERNSSFTSSRAFFSETLAAVGALNATTGRRHFTFKAALLEALCAATIDPGCEVEFQDFCGLLQERYRLILDERGAQVTGLTTDIDAGVFKKNAEAFRQQLAATGLLTHFSDATSLVRGEAE